MKVWCRMWLCTSLRWRCITSWARSPSRAAVADAAGDLAGEAGMDGLALEAVAVLAQPPPAGVALAGAHDVEQAEQQGVARGRRDGAVEGGVGPLVGGGVPG